MPGKVRAFDVEIREVIPETPDTVTLVLDRVDASIPEYRAGQFLTIDPHQFPALRPMLAYLEHTKGKKELTRAYSLSSAPHEPYPAVTVKQEPYVPGVHLHPPVLSPFLVHAASPGLRMHVHGFTGPYVLPDDVESRTDHLVHVVAGSGAVPNFAILKDSLHVHRALRHTFVCSNKTFEDICFREALAALEREHPNRLRVIHTLTREPDLSRHPGIRAGRIDRALLAEAIGDAAGCLVYVCGPAVPAWERRAALAKHATPPPRFLETVISDLHALGVSPDRIKREAYG